MLVGQSQRSVHWRQSLDAGRLVQQPRDGDVTDGRLQPATRWPDAVAVDPVGVAHWYPLLASRAPIEMRLIQLA
jgi:hypothetical protein